MHVAMSGNEILFWGLVVAAINASAAVVAAWASVRQSMRAPSSPMAVPTPPPAAVSLSPAAADLLADLTRGVGTLRAARRRATIAGLVVATAIATATSALLSLRTPAADIPAVVVTTFGIAIFVILVVRDRLGSAVRRTFDIRGQAKRLPARDITALGAVLMTSPGPLAGSKMAAAIREGILEYLQ